MVKIIGLLIIIGSFVFVLKSPDKSMMDRLLEKKKAKQPMDAAGTEGESNESDSQKK